MSVLTETANTPKAWSDRAARELTSWEACGWSYGGQRDRMLKIIDVLAPASEDSLLDFGCGTGELARYIADDIAYLGYDSAHGMIERARREHPDREFQCWEPSERFDLVAIVGTFNLPGDKLLTWAALRRLWDLTGRRLAVSLYAGDDGRCLTYTENEVAKFAAGESYHHHVERWRHNDIVMVLSR